MSVLQRGSSGPGVMALQFRLEELGFDPGGIDGSFGPGTERAVRAFQDLNGLTVDGVVGDTTAAALNFDPDAEIPSGFPGVSVTAVSQMFSPHTPRCVVQHPQPPSASLTSPWRVPEAIDKLIQVYNKKATPSSGQRTRFAEGRRGGDVAQKPSAVAGTARSNTIRRPERQRKEYRTSQ